MQQTLVILVVGLSPALVGQHTPHLQALARRGGLRPMTAVCPAVTCSAQSSLVTGLLPEDHGIVGNGWYFRDQAEVWLWRQSTRLVKGEKIWDTAKRLNPEFTCAKMFWWYNMYSTAEWSATPRPRYPADGLKIPDHYTYPPELHDELDERLGEFPLFNFWGPLADIRSSRWISDATQYVMETKNPTLTLTYLPHLDYNLQRLGPDLTNPVLQKDLAEIDQLCGNLIEAADKNNQNVIVVSEYGITPVTDAIPINRVLRKAGYLAVRDEKGQEQLDAGASEAFAVVDHQIAHVYVNSMQNKDSIKELLTNIDGVEHVYDSEDRHKIGLNHERSGDFIVIAKADRWFSYYFWLEEQRAPDYAKTVDIHRKPGYDPVELFLDPTLKFPSLSVAWRLIKKKLGFRTLLNVISQSHTQQVKGSHGRPTDSPDHGPLVISSRADLLPNENLHTIDFKDLVLDHVFGCSESRESDANHQNGKRKKVY